MNMKLPEIEGLDSERMIEAISCMNKNFWLVPALTDKLQSSQKNNESVRFTEAEYFMLLRMMAAALCIMRQANQEELRRITEG